MGGGYLQVSADSKVNFCNYVVIDQCWKINLSLTWLDGDYYVHRFSCLQLALHNNTSIQIFIFVRLWLIVSNVKQWQANQK
jgi:hypothetical protein